jgi:hypothetical protein
MMLAGQGRRLVERLAGDLHLAVHHALKAFAGELGGLGQRFDVAALISENRLDVEAGHRETGECLAEVGVEESLAELGIEKGLAEVGIEKAL